MATSPACYDIYMEDFLEQVRLRLRNEGIEDFWYLAYADDLVFRCQYDNFERCLALVEEVAQEYGLQINFKKSGIFCSRTLDFRSKFPVVDSYKYLGVTMEKDGCLEPHLRTIMERSLYLKQKLAKIKSNLRFDNKYLLWNCYVRSYYLYLAPVINTQEKKLQDKFCTMWRKSLK